jgi:hypothetical protein
MKVILKFDLPDEQNEYEITYQAQRMQSFICDLESQLRSWYKYGHPFKDADEAVNQIREQFYILANQHNVDLDL